MIKSPPKLSYQPLSDEHLLALAEEVLASPAANHDYLSDLHKRGHLSLIDLNEVIRAKSRFKQILRKGLPGNHLEDSNGDLEKSHSIADKLGWEAIEEPGKSTKWMGTSGRVIDRLKLEGRTLSVRQKVQSLSDTKLHLRAHHFKKLAADGSVNLIRVMIFQVGASIQDELIFKRRGDHFTFDPHRSHIKSEMENAVFLPLKKLAEKMGFAGINGASSTAPYFEHAKFPGGLFSMMLGRSSHIPTSRSVLKIDEILSADCLRQELSQLVQGGALKRLGLSTLEYKSADAVVTRHHWRPIRRLDPVNNPRGPFSPKRFKHWGALRGSK